jgi:TolA-binding protein
MNSFYISLQKFIIFFVLLLSLSNFATAEDEQINAVTDQLNIIAQDLKTLEKAVYKTSDISTFTNSIPSSGLNEEILTRHLLKLNEIEDQFRLLTNRFEEVNFKLDKLSNRVTKIQSDSQLRFLDLETGKTTSVAKSNKTKKTRETKKIQVF